MKSFSLLTLAPIISANIANINMSNKTDTSKSAMFNRLLSQIGSFKELNGYGCWCYYDTHGPAKGPVQDVYDQFCQDLHKAYTCIQMEHPGDCVPWEIVYNYEYGDDLDSIKAACMAENTEECAQKACMVEITFHYRVAEIVMSNPIDQTLRHDNGFEPSTTCLPQTKGNGRGLRPDECCSEYPFRFPYSSDNGVRSCCGSKTYGTANLECCDETSSTLESIGNCLP